MKKVFVLTILLFILFSCSKNHNNKNELSKSSAEPKVVYPKSDDPIVKEFELLNWKQGHGKLQPNPNITDALLQSVSWHYLEGILTFSNNHHYLFGSVYSGPLSIGSYTLDSNVITFKPPLLVYRYDKPYLIISLQYSNKKHLQGFPVLIDNNNSVVFTNFEDNEIALNESVLINGLDCKKIWEKTNILQNNVLNTLPSIRSMNLFSDNYYGNISVDSNVVKVAFVEVDGKKWYYCYLDFSSGDPTDGGGPYYQGWLPGELLQ